MSNDLGKDHGAGCVLIVDDEEDVRDSLKDVVEMMGCSAVLMEGAKSALDYLKHGLPCLIVLDLLMPGMTGTEMLEALRADESLAKVPVVISTSAPDRVPRGTPVLPKPIDVDALCGWIERVCHCAS